MLEKEKDIRVTLYVPEKDYRKLKSKLVMFGRSVSGWFREQIKKELSK